MGWKSVRGQSSGFFRSYLPEMGWNSAALGRRALMAGVGEAPRCNSRSVLVLQGLKKGVGVLPSPAAVVALTLAALAGIIYFFIFFFFFTNTYRNRNDLGGVWGASLSRAAPAVRDVPAPGGDITDGGTDGAAARSEKRSSTRRLIEALACPRCPEQVVNGRMVPNFPRFSSTCLLHR